MRYVNPEDYLIHYGIKGQSWGKRRFQNTDGTLTAAGKARYYKKGDGTGTTGGKEYRQKTDNTHIESTVGGYVSGRNAEHGANTANTFNDSTSISYYNDSTTKTVESQYAKSQEMARKYQDRSNKKNKPNVIESQSALENAGSPGWESLGKIRKANRISQEMARKYQDKSLKRVKSEPIYGKGLESAKKFAGAKLGFYASAGSLKGKRSESEATKKSRSDSMKNSGAALNAGSGIKEGKRTAGPMTFRTHGSVHNFGAVVGASDGKKAPSKDRQTKWKGSTSGSGFNNGIIEGSKKKKSRGTNIKGIKSGSKFNSGINNGKRPR